MKDSTTAGTWVVPVKREKYVTAASAVEATIGGDTLIGANWLVAVPDGSTSMWASLNVFANLAVTGDGATGDVHRTTTTTTP